MEEVRFEMERQKGRIRSARALAHWLVLRVKRAESEGRLG